MGMGRVYQCTGGQTSRGPLGEDLETNQRRSHSEARWRQEGGGVGRDPTPVTHVSGLRQKSNDSGWRAKAWQLVGRDRGIVQTLGGDSPWWRDLEDLGERCVRGGGDPRRILSAVVFVGGWRGPSGHWNGWPPPVQGSLMGSGVPSASILRPQSPIPSSSLQKKSRPKGRTTATTIQGLPDTEVEPLGSCHTYSTPDSHECHAPGRQEPPLPAPGVLPSTDNVLSRNPIITTPPSMPRPAHVGPSGREEASTLRKRQRRKHGAHRQQLVPGKD